MRFSRRSFIQRALAAGALGLVRPSFLFAQSASGTIKNFIHIFLYGGADPRFIFPYLAGPLHEQLKILRPNAYPLNATSTQVVPYARIDQGSRVNPVGFHVNWQELIDKVTAVNCGLALVTEYGVTGNNSFSHDVAQKHFLAGTTRDYSRLQQGWLGKLIDVARLPAMSAWLLGLTEPFFSFSHTEQPMVLQSLSSFAFADRSTGSFACPTRLCGSRGSDMTSDNVDDSAFARSLAKELAGESHPGMAYDEAFRAAWANVYRSVPIIKSINADALDSAQFRPASGATAGIQNILMDITKAIHYTNSTAAAPELRSASKIFCTGLGGWDAHTNISSSYPGLILGLASALKGAVHYLAQWGLLEQTAIVVQTEFGRTTKQNGSLGLDHAAASYCLLLGGRVRSAVHGPDASLDEAASKNYFTPQVPFTSVLKKILSRSGFSTSELQEVLPDVLPGEGDLPLFT